MALDEQLLNKQEADNTGADDSGFDSVDDFDSGQSEDEPDDFRAAKKNQDPIDPDGNNQAGTNDLAAAKQLNRRQQAYQAGLVAKKEEASASEGGAATAPVKQAAGSCLKQSWLNLIPSWFTSLFIPNLFVFLRVIGFKSMIPKLGTEWKPAGLSAKPVAPGKNKDDGDDAASKSAGLVEGMGLVCLDLGCFLLILVIVGFIALLLKVVSNPLEILKSVLSYLWSLFSG